MSVLELDERQLCAALRRGDEAAFANLVSLYHAPLRRVALSYVRTVAVADEVVQETWLGVIRGIDRFEGRSSLKTWIFRILTNIAKTRAARENRTVPLSALTPVDDGAAVDPTRFLDEQHERWPGHWASPPARWDELPEEQLAGRETLDALKLAVEALPLKQRQVIVLRDIEGWKAEEVCELLSLSQANQRVLLHRARSKIRQALESHLGQHDPSSYARPVTPAA
jgi:RNA polymerase sigma-70 factor (ECF subfamily)